MKRGNQSPGLRRVANSDIRILPIQSSRAASVAASEFRRPRLPTRPPLVALGGGRFSLGAALGDRTGNHSTSAVQLLLDGSANGDRLGGIAGLNVVLRTGRGRLGQRQDSKRKHRGRTVRDCAEIGREKPRGCQGP